MNLKLNYTTINLKLLELLIISCVIIPRRFDYLSPIKDISLNIFIALISILLILVQVTQKKLLIKNKKLITLILLLLGIYGCGHIFVTTIINGEYYKFDYVYMSTMELCIAIILMLIILYIDWSKEFLNRLLNKLSFWIVISLCLGIVYSISSPEKLVSSGNMRVISAGENILRAMSPIGGPNAIGSIASFMIPIFLSISYSNINNSRMYKIYMIISIIALILSGSKTSFISLIISIVVFGIISKKIHKEHIFVAILGCIGISLTRVMDLLTSGGNLLNIGGSDRAIVWNEAKNLIIGKPIIGWGNDYLFNSVTNFHAHNLWLQILLNNGIIIGSIIIFIIISITLYIVIKYTSHKNIIMIGFISGIVAFFISSIADYLFWESRVLIIYCLLLPTIFILGRDNKCIYRILK